MMKYCPYPNCGEIDEQTRSIIESNEFKEFVSKCFNKHRYINSITLCYDRNELTRILYDGYIFYI